MLARWWALLVWALVAASALFWGLRLFVKPTPTPRDAMVAQAGSGARGDLTRLFGVDPPPPVVESVPAPVADDRFQLVG
ncbi:MAG: general secretion pathway protein C, partial [Chitinophagaceae bacterium]|nr:general secretion pathway protein C [Rubrivivax sp.]